ncbi:branched-chain amino acid ABC transporter permease [Cryobacterium sp. Y82]|uniref:branched-chain amino acid ABC transporter permease n=1 Tax=Cryobacterium sp. Y82 TaxID=2045017 RepID=UPI000CE4552A|nr:branched-chain amino acid ABC transporter permease [Cryobacterium sp. Y82]
METALQLLLAGVATGSIYGLIALGFLVIHHATGIVNFAQGQMLMIGTVSSYIILSQLGIGYLLAVPLIVIIGIVLSLAFNNVLVKPLVRRNAPVYSVVVGTIAVGLLLEEGAALIVGDQMHGVPPVMPNVPIQVGSLTVLPQTVITVVVAWAIVGAIWLFFNRTITGVSLRAVGINRTGAAVSGISVPRLIAIAFGISIVVTVIAGMLIAPTLGAGPHLGFDIGVKAFAAAILGGFDSVYRGMIAGVFIGVLEIFTAYYVSSAFAPTIAYAVLLLALCLQPLRSGAVRMPRRRKQQLA